MDVARLILEYFQALIWPILVGVLFYCFRTEIKLLLSRLSSLKFGDNSIDFFRSELDKARVLSRDVRSDPEADEEKRERMASATKIPLTDANTQLLKHGLRPSPSGLELDYYRGIADRDPALALTGLRIELEIIGKNLAKGFNVDVAPSLSITGLFSELVRFNAVSNKQFELVQSITQLADSAVHGASISREDAKAVIGTADVLRDQYLSWLSWGFDGTD